METSEPQKKSSTHKWWVGFTWWWLLWWDSQSVKKNFTKVTKPKTNATKYRTNQLIWKISLSFGARFYIQYIHQLLQGIPSDSNKSKEIDVSIRCSGKKQPIVKLPIKILRLQFIGISVTSHPVQKTICFFEAKRNLQSLPGQFCECKRDLFGHGFMWPPKLKGFGMVADPTIGDRGWSRIESPGSRYVFGELPSIS